jgi:CMP-N,N'-diacetyllegionaminic acid synthase
LSGNVKNIAIIPARSGSKRLPDKNIRMLCGKPLLAYSVEAALQSGMFDIVHVSTDSEKYAEIAKSYGADVPFLRSAENSSDIASSWDTVLEVLDSYSKRGCSFHNIMLLQPTSPLRTYDDIITAFALMDEKKAKAIVSVCQGHYHNTLSIGGAMAGFIRNEANRKRKQDTDKYYRINGAIYLMNTAYFLDDQNIYRDSCFAHIMDKSRSADIDDELDLLFAETVLINRGKLSTTLSQTP